MRHEVAIYATSSRSAGLYDRSVARDGGAERQMTLLARSLALRGHDVVHIIFPPRDPLAPDYPVTLVHRAPRKKGGRKLARPLLEALAVWRALRAADADVVVMRSASPVLAVAALYCSLRRRRLIFSSSNVSDLTLERIRSRWKQLPYKLGVRRADAVVVQSEEQRQLALDTFPALSRVVHIPSFAETAERRSDSRPQPEAFLWFGRSVPDKQPLRYVDLARSLPEARFVMIPTDEQADSRMVDVIRTAARGASNLVLLDPMPHERLSELIERSVAVVNTSTLEGMPNAFLEAWLAGVPVLTLQFDPDGVVARRQLGISAGGSWERFVAGARELWDSRAAREELAGRVVEHVRDEHSPEVVGRRWSELIDDVRSRG